MPLKPEKYRSIKAQTIPDPATRAAFEDIAQRLEQLARDAESRVSGLDAVPVGTIVFWLGAVNDIPTGWEVATELNGRFPRGMSSPAAGATGGATGGATDHTHNMSNATSQVGLNYSVGGSYVELPHAFHSHVNSSSAHIPPYVDGVWIRKT